MKTPLMKTRLGKKLRNESGQALIITIMCLTVLLGFCRLRGGSRIYVLHQAAIANRRRRRRPCGRIGFDY